MSKEAMKLALAWMEKISDHVPDEFDDEGIAVVKALYAALAKQEHDEYDEVAIAYGLPQQKQELDPVHEYRKGFIAGQIDMRDRSEEHGEPVAWMTTEANTGVQVWLYEKTAVRYQNPPTPLYTTPQPIGFAVMERPWVGLTDEERNDLCYDFGEKSLWSFADSIEAKLREKNSL